MSTCPASCSDNGEKGFLNSCGKSRGWHKRMAVKGRNNESNNDGDYETLFAMI